MKKEKLSEIDRHKLKEWQLDRDNVPYEQWPSDMTGIELETQESII